MIEITIKPRNPQELAAVIQWFNDAFLAPAAAAEAQQSVETAAPEAQETVAEDAEAPTLDQVRAALTQYGKDNGPAKLKDLLKDFDAARIGDLKAEDYAIVLERIGK